MSSQIGCDVVAIDCYADVDTRQVANQVFKVASLACPDIRAAVLEVRQSYVIDGIVYGSGLENYPETIKYLQAEWPLFGNSAEVFRKVQDKSYFFQLLAQLRIAHPATSFAASSPGDGWIFKPWCGEGGIGITHNKASAGDEGYWQRYIHGQAMSVLFLSSATDVDVIGFNRQWCATQIPEKIFLFGGIASHAELAAETRCLITEAVRKLSAAYRLCGLNTLDFMLDANGFYVLEINPRISASAQLYGSELLLLHMAAFEAAEISALNISGQPSAYQIVYATKDCEIGAGLDWPDWVVDRPVAGSIFGVGQPICSIIATGKNSRQVAEQLEHRQAILQTLLESGC